MGHEFELTDAAEVDATPEQLWEAIATGPGIDSWFMGRNEVEGGTGGVIRGTFGGYRPEFGIREWEPLERLVYGTDAAPDGRRIAYEFLIEGREGGSSVIRCVTSGFLPGDDWEDEFEAMTTGARCSSARWSNTSRTSPAARRCRSPRSARRWGTGTRPGRRWARRWGCPRGP